MADRSLLEPPHRYEATGSGLCMEWSLRKLSARSFACHLLNSDLFEAGSVLIPALPLALFDEKHLGNAPKTGTAALEAASRENIRVERCTFLSLKLARDNQRWS